MDCEQAKQLFDAYLDGELSPALATEFGAHRVRCPDCRRALALLEVSGHIIASDSDATTVPEDFTDRLVACMDAPAVIAWPQRLRKVVYFAVPLAAAAVVGLAFVGLFDRGGDRMVAGKIESKAPGTVSPLHSATILEEADAFDALDDDDAVPMDAGTRAVQDVIDSGRWLHKSLDMTLLQLIDVLEAAKQAEIENEALETDSQADDVVLPTEDGATSD